MTYSIRLLFIFLLQMPFTGVIAQGSLHGKITSQGQPVPGATIQIAKTKLAVATDTNGIYELAQIPSGKYEAIISATGFTTAKRTVNIMDGQVATLETTLQERYAGLNEVVVTGTRTNRRRLESPVAVNILDSKTFDLTQSNTLSDGLCFQPGLRMETDCQTCNYSQLRMNGLGGSYSQILINSRPVFTSLMSLYGLEQIPANMIDRVEVVRGGGSVLYGTSAIAGTVNVITKDPEQNSFNLSANTASVNGRAADNVFNANVNTVNSSKNAGISIFASHRDRQAYDANGDGYSEMPRLLNNSFGFNAFTKLDTKNRLDINGWSINEERRGGNKIDEQADKADQSEYRLHNILVGGFNFDHIFREKKSWISIYGSGQNTKRTHYTGLDHADAWGHTRNHSLQGGIQYNYVADHFPGGKNTFTAGAEQQYEYTYDEIKAYNYLVDQEVKLLGGFVQSDWDISNKLTLLSGMRLNQSNRVSKLVATPRLALLYKAGINTQLRASYARGFKAPQAFETDMHIAFANGGVSLIRIDPNLKEEISDSYNFSADFNKANETLIYGFTVDAFYTSIANCFILQETGTDANGNQQLMRTNGAGATVKGVTLEARINYSQQLQLESGITVQESRYDAPVHWSADAAGSDKFMRTPGTYGFYTLSFFPKKKLSGSLSGVYTGPMDVPHFAGAPGVTADQVKVSPSFFEQNIKLAYRFTVTSIKQDIQLSAGVQNIFNNYQDDFDTGKNRDSNYIYGPSRPRTFFIGIKLGTF